MTTKQQIFKVSTVFLFAGMFLAALALVLVGSDLPVAWADPGTIYVDADAPGPGHDGLTWTTAYTNVQDALAAAVAGDEIWVAEGIYYPDEGGGQMDNDRTATFTLTNGVALYGGFVATETLRAERDWTAHVTVLSGDIDQDDTTDVNGVITDTDNITGTNAYHVVRADGTITESAVLDGFTITAGHANGSDSDIYGGGMYNEGDPTLVNLTFSGNEVAFNGGGMYNGGGDPALVNVTFSSNKAANTGGGMHSLIGSPTLTDVTFDGNLVDKAAGGCSGGGMYVDRGGPTLTGGTFSNNQALCGNSGGGAGLYNRDSTLSLTDVTFVENYATSSGGGMNNYNSDATLTDVAFIGCTGERGGGMYNNSGSITLINVIFSGNLSNYYGAGLYNDNWSGSAINPSLTNVTFNGNRAVANGGGIYNQSDTVTLVNCILWGNSPNQVAGPAAVVVNYSDVQGGYGSGTGNIDADPQFITPVDAASAPTTTGDLRLCDTSPAINAGDNSVVTVATDLAGDPRIMGNAVDMGAYEFLSMTLLKSLTPTAVSYHGTVTYTVVLVNYLSAAEVNAVFTDTLPGEVDFVAWVAQPAGASESGDEITWTGTLAANTAITFTFTAAHIGDYGDTVTNTAEYSGSVAFDTSATFHVGGILYVDADATGAGTGLSWTDAFTEVQSALVAAWPDDEIWVAEGEYRPDYDPGSGTYTGDRTATFQLRSGVALYGGFAGGETGLDQRDWTAHVTTLSGDVGTVGDSSDNAYHVVTGSSADGTAVLDGFTITGGYADGGGLDNHGAGMYNSVGSPALHRVIFSDNSAAGRGGGMYNLNASSPTLFNCVLRGNSANNGGGIGNRSGSNPQLVNVIFSGNSANNSGGGMHNYDSDPALTNITLSGNSAASDGGGMYNASSSNPVVRNSILWGNTPDQIYNDSSTPNVAYSDVEGGYSGGTGNVDADPQFVDADGSDDVDGTSDDDLRLRSSSPVIDAGNNTAVPADTLDLDGDDDTVEPFPYDLDGQSRFVDIPTVLDTGNGTPPIVDMGAHEKQLNDAPIAVDDTASTDEDTPVTVSVLANDDDPDAGDTLSVTAVGTPNYGSAAISGTTQVVYTPADRVADYSGVFTYTVSDGSLAATATVSISVSADNRPPVADAGDDQTVTVDATVTLDGGDSYDPDGHTPLTYGWTQTGGPTVALSDSTAVSLTFDAPGTSTVLTFTLTVTDSLGLPDPTPDEVVISIEGNYVYLPLVVRD